MKVAYPLWFYSEIWLWISQNVCDLNQLLNSGKTRSYSEFPRPIEMARPSPCSISPKHQRKINTIIKPKGNTICRASHREVWLNSRLIPVRATIVNKPKSIQKFEGCRTSEVIFLSKSGARYVRTWEHRISRDTKRGLDNMKPTGSEISSNLRDCIRSWLILLLTNEIGSLTIWMRRKANQQTLSNALSSYSPKTGGDLTEDKEKTAENHRIFT